MPKIFGYKKDLPSTRDLKFKDFLQKLGNPSTNPLDVDLSAYCVVMDQQNLSSCVGNATAESVEILNNIAGYKPTPLSRLFIYAMARIENGDLDKDEGTFIRSAFDTLSKFGVCDEYLWPYNESKVLVSPPLMAQRQAAGHRIHSYFRIDSTGEARLNDIITALQLKHPVVFGTSVTQAFMDIVDRTPISQPSSTDKILGGHALVVVGYLNGMFLIKNSWGTTWGSQGFCLMSPDYLTWSETDDLWVPTLGMNF